MHGTGLGAHHLDPVRGPSGEPACATLELSATKSPWEAVWDTALENLPLVLVKGTEYRPVFYMYAP